MALKGTMKAGNIKPADVQALFMGNVLDTGLGENMARQVALHSGMSEASAAVTINEVCGSSLKALRPSSRTDGTRRFGSSSCRR